MYVEWGAFSLNSHNIIKKIEELLTWLQEEGFKFYIFDGS